VILDKYQFIKKQLSKTNKKNDENYVVSRIWHLINNVDVKMITQQYILRDLVTKHYALADIYFPQFGFIVEIDELYHQTEEMLIRDKIRQKDIVQALECEVYRVTVSNNIVEVNKQVDSIVFEIHKMIEEDGFVPWDLQAEYNPITYIRTGFIDANDHPVFKTVSDCCNCFGAGYNGLQHSGALHKYQSEIDIKGLKFYPNGDWNNQLEADEEHFTEFNFDPVKNQEYLEKRLYKMRHELALFAHVKSELGGYEYVFKGWYRLDVEETQRIGKLFYKRVSKIMPTYYPKDEKNPNILAKAFDQEREIARFYDEKVLAIFQKKYPNYQIILSESIN